MYLNETVMYTERG